MKTRSKKDFAKTEQKFGGNSVNNERETEAEHILHPFPSPSECEELDTTIKVENYSERDEDHVGNIVKCEFVEFHSNQAEEIYLQKDVNTVLLEKIPKTETEILGDYIDDEPPSCSYEVDDPFNNDTFGDSELNLDLDPNPECDPFADVDCDPSVSRHPPMWLFNCQFCPLIFALKDELVAHLASHPEATTTDKEDFKRWPYRCQECPSTFSHYKVYALHMLSHKNEDPLKCPEPNCRKAFKIRSRLKTHLQLGHSEDKRFACPESNCGKTFKTNGVLKNHVICHSEERPFKCFHSDCCKTFKRKDRLKEHLALHTKACHLKLMTKRTFKCPEPGCFLGYTKAYSLKFHIKQKHKR